LSTVDLAELLRQDETPAQTISRLQRELVQICDQLAIWRKLAEDFRARYEAAQAQVERLERLLREC
jgi:predicted Zn-dependent protease